MADEPTTVKVDVLRYHTYGGEVRLEGTSYDAEPQYLETLEALGFVRRAEIKATPKPRGK